MENKRKTDFNSVVLLDDTNIDSLLCFLDLLHLAGRFCDFEYYYVLLSGSILASKSDTSILYV